MTDLKAKILLYIDGKEMGKLKEALAEPDSIEILYAISELSPKDKAIVFRLLPKEDALFIFEQLPGDLQQELLLSFTDEKANEIIGEMAPDDRVRLLDEMPAIVAKKFISNLSPEERKATNILMGYEPETAGRIMTTEYIALRPSMTVAEAIDKIKRQAKEKETIYTLYVTDDATRKLIGVVSLRQLLIAQAEQIIGDIMLEAVIKVSTDTDQEEIAKKLQEFDLLAIPVVDSEDVLVGIVTIDDAMDIMQAEATEDLFDNAGLGGGGGKSESDRSKTLVSGSLWKIWRVRLPFLAITLVAGILAGFVIDGFEYSLSAIPAVAVFIPLIMDMGGNIGTQSSTVFARGVVLGHINMKKFRRHLAKEILVGLSLGILVGGASLFVAWIWFGEILLGLSVALALVTTITLASFLGFFVPFLLIKINIDQAAGSAPIITSIKDIVGLLVYFLSITLFMGIL